MNIKYFNKSSKFSANNQLRYNMRIKNYRHDQKQFSQLNNLSNKATDNKLKCQLINKMCSLEAKYMNSLNHSYKNRNEQHSKSKKCCLKTDITLQMYD